MHLIFIGYKRPFIQAHISNKHEKETLEKYLYVMLKALRVVSSKSEIHSFNDLKNILTENFAGYKECK